MCVWQVLRLDCRYEICTDYPYPVRKISDHRVVREFHESSGYYRLTLAKKKFYKHRVVASQFIENDDPDRKTQVDHINNDREDFRVSNLRWCTPSENNKNRGGHTRPFEYVDEIPDDAIVVDHYNDHCFDNLYYRDGVFYTHNGSRCRKFNILSTKAGSPFICAQSTEGKEVKIYYTKFKQLYRFVL